MNNPPHHRAKPSTVARIASEAASASGMHYRVELFCAGGGAKAPHSRQRIAWWDWYGADWTVSVARSQPGGVSLVDADVADNPLDPRARVHRTLICAQCRRNIPSNDDFTLVHPILEILRHADIHEISLSALSTRVTSSRR